MTPNEKARAWREKLGYNRQELGDALGYSPEYVYWMERGVMPPRKGQKSKPIEPWVWQRYRLACRGHAADLRDKNRWDW